MTKMERIKKICEFIDDHAGFCYVEPRPDNKVNITLRGSHSTEDSLMPIDEAEEFLLDHCHTIASPGTVERLKQALEGGVMPKKAKDQSMIDFETKYTIMHTDRKTKRTMTFELDKEQDVRNLLGGLMPSSSNCSLCSKRVGKNIGFEIVSIALNELTKKEKRKVYILCNKCELQIFEKD